MASTCLQIARALRPEVEPGGWEPDLLINCDSSQTLEVRQVWPPSEEAKGVVSVDTSEGLSLEIPSHLRAEYEREAESQGMTLSEFTRAALAHYRATLAH